MSREKCTVWLAGFNYGGDLVIKELEAERTSKTIYLAEGEKLIDYRRTFDVSKANWTREEALRRLRAELGNEIGQLNIRLSDAHRRDALAREAQSDSSS